MKGCFSDPYDLIHRIVLDLQIWQLLLREHDKLQMQDMLLLKKYLLFSLPHTILSLSNPYLSFSSSFPVSVSIIWELGMRSEI